MSSATFLDTRVVLDNSPITNKLCYRINGEYNNPTLTVYKGFLYRINVQTDLSHPFVIKQSPGSLNLGIYNKGIVGNSTYNSVIEWLVQQDTPNYLIYQSPSNPDMMGLIEVKTPDSYNPNGMKLLDESKLNSISLSDLVNIFNHNCSIALTTNDKVAGRGLTIKNRKLELDTYGNARFFLDNLGRLISADTKVLLRDNLSNLSSFGNPDLLYNALNVIASAIRQLKDNTKSFNTPSTYTLEDICEIAEEVEDYVQNIQSTLINLQRRYNQLLEDYKSLEEYFKNHTHDSSDIKTGILSPSILGRGIPSRVTYLRGDGFWVEVD
jgi:hypothetical protein